MAAPEYIHTVKVEELAHKEDGQIVEYAEPVPCDCCGKVCTVKVHHLSTGDRVGKDCAFVLERASSDAYYGNKVDEAYVRALLRANKRQVAYLRAAHVIA